MSERFILVGRPELIRALAEVIKRDPELKLIAVAAPERLVADMPVQRAELFRQALGGQLVVERDEELQQFI